MELIDKPAVTLLDVEPKTLGDKDGDVEAKRLVDTLDENFPEAETERHWGILGDVKAEALADPLAFTQAEGVAETFEKTNSYTEEEKVANRLGDTSAMSKPRHCFISLLTFFHRQTLRQLGTHTGMGSLKN